VLADKDLLKVPHETGPTDAAAAQWVPARSSLAQLDKAFHLAILDVMHNPGAAGYSRRDRHDPERGIRVAVNSVDGWFEDNLANHAATARAIEGGDVKNAAMPWSTSLVSDRSRLSRRKAGAGRRNGPPGGSRSLRKK
jgi:GntR family transcriptional regulator, galactonate operon transcriptional repressor